MTDPHLCLALGGGKEPRMDALTLLAAAFVGGLVWSGLGLLAAIWFHRVREAGRRG